MLSRDEDLIITERLTNWGRAIADHRHARTSPLYWLRIASAIAEGGRIGSSSPLPDIDYADAEEINRAWRKLPERPERYRKAKHILVLWFATPGSTRRLICNTLQIHGNHIQLFLDMGKELLYGNIYGIKPQNLDKNT